MGINTRNVKLLAFAMGATFGGVSGGLFAAFQGFISPESFTLLDSIMILCMVVLGGMGHVRRYCAGGRVVNCAARGIALCRPTPAAVARAVFTRSVGFAHAALRACAGLMMLFRPAGLWPSSVGAAESRAHASRAGGEEPIAGASALLSVEGVSKRFGGLSAASCPR